MDAIIKTENLNKTYFNGKYKTEAVKDISVEIYPGEKIAITGPSGCGKTTLLNMVGLVIKPTKGKLYLEGKEILELSDRKASRYRNKFFGYVVQDFALMEEEAVFNNIEIPLLYAEKKLNRLKRKALIEELINRFGLNGMSKQKVKNLSGGQRQRVAIARAMANDPQIILADEPTGALDSKNTEEVFEILSSLTKQGKTLILITHNEELARRCDREISMKDGVVVDYNAGV